MGDLIDILAIHPDEVGLVPAAKTRGVLDDRVEHRLQLEH